MITESTHTSLERVASIKDKTERRAALRELLAQRKAIAMLIQYTYHPDVQFDLYKGPTPNAISQTHRSNHEDFTLLYRMAKKLSMYGVNNHAIDKQKKELLWTGMIADLPRKDGELLDCVKDKRLPWKTLNRQFVLHTVPELFPSSFVEAAGKDEEPEE